MAERKSSNPWGNLKSASAQRGYDVIREGPQQGGTEKERTRRDIERKREMREDVEKAQRTQRESMLGSKEGPPRSGFRPSTQGWGRKPKK